MGIAGDDPAADGTAAQPLSGRRITVFPGWDWTESPAFADWMMACILRRLRPAGTEIAAEFNCPLGIGATVYCLFARAVACVSSRARPFSNLSGESRLIPVRARVGDVASGRVRLPHDGYDIVLVRLIADHVTDPAAAIAGLTALLRPGGQLLVVVRPPQIGHPLFAQALDLFARRQPDPARIATAMRAAGLDTGLSYDSYPLTFSTRKWLRMIRERYLPLLSQFSDAQLEAGAAQIRQDHPGTRVEITDTFAFISGTAP